MSQFPYDNPYLNVGWGADMTLVRLELAKQYLREHGISQPRVQIGALYVPPAAWQQPITKEMSIIQEVLLNGNGQRASRS